MCLSQTHFFSKIGILGVLKVFKSHFSSLTVVPCTLWKKPRLKISNGQNRAWYLCLSRTHFFSKIGTLGVPRVFKSHFSSLTVVPCTLWKKSHLKISNGQNRAWNLCLSRTHFFSKIGTLGVPRVFKSYFSSLTVVPCTQWKKNHLKISNGRNRAWNMCLSRNDFFSKIGTLGVPKVFKSHFSSLIVVLCTLWKKPCLKISNGQNRAWNMCLSRNHFFSKIGTLGVPRVFKIYFSLLTVVPCTQCKKHLLKICNGWNRAWNMCLSRNSLFLKNRYLRRA